MDNVGHDVGDADEREDGAAHQHLRDEQHGRPLVLVVAEALQQVRRAGVEPDGRLVDGAGDALVQLAEGVVVEEPVDDEGDAVDEKRQPDQQVEGGQQPRGGQVVQARRQVGRVRGEVVVDVEPVVQAQRQRVPAYADQR